MLSKLHKEHQPFLRTSRGKTDYSYHGRRVILDRDCGQGPSGQAVVDDLDSDVSPCNYLCC